MSPGLRPFVSYLIPGRSAAGELPCLSTRQARALHRRSVRGTVSPVFIHNPEVLVLCHGGPIATPEDAQYIFDHTEGIAGFFGAGYP